MITSGGTPTLGLYDNASEIRKKADISYVDSRVGDFQAQVVSVAGGHKAYTTLALAQADQPNLPANSIVEITNDGANNGTYQWNGTTLTKSAYDPLTQAKAYADIKDDVVSSTVQQNRKYAKTLIPNINYFRNSNGALANDNTFAYSDYVAVKAGDVVKVYVYARDNRPVVVWCDPTKTTFSRLDSISSSSTVEYKTEEVVVLADGFITVNTSNRTANDIYFYAYYDESLFIRPDQLNKLNGVQGYDLAQKQFNDVALNRTKEVLPYSSPKLVWSLGNGTDLNNDSGNAFRHTQFIRVKAGDLIEASLIRMSNSTGGFLDIFVGDDRVNRSERVPVTNIDAVTRVGTLKKEIAQDGWVAFSTAYTGYDMSLVNITIYNNEMYLPADRKTNEITVFGDSLSQGMGNAASLVMDVSPWEHKLNRNGIGGENIFDTSFRAGSVPLWIKGGFTIPASKSEYANIDARWLFNETVTIDSNGDTVVDARNITSFANAVIATIEGKKVRLDKASSDNFGRAQWRVRFDVTQDSAMTVNDSKIVFADSAGQKSGIGVMMMGTNGGMFDYGQNINDRAFTRKQLDEIIELFKRNTRLFFDEKVIVWGYHGVFTNAISDEYGVATTSRKYFRAACQKAFGEKFIDMYGYLVGKGLSDLRVELNSDEITFIQAQDGVTNGAGGNSFLPLWSGDNTHPRTIVYQAMMNAAFGRMHKLGWIEDHLQIPLNFISDLSATPTTSSITVGATTNATASYTDPANSSDIFEWSSSNPDIATVTNGSWVNSWTSAARKTTTITGVSAGTATITCKCRFGGATASFNITVA